MLPTLQKHILSLSMAWAFLQLLRYFPLMSRAVPHSGGVALSPLRLGPRRFRFQDPEMSWNEEIDPFIFTDFRGKVLKPDCHNMRKTDA